jgi:hypothetical protein
MSGNWTTISKSEYLSHCAEVRPHHDWSKFGSDSIFRERILRDDSTIRESLSQAYLPWYYDKSGEICSFNSPQAKNFRVDEYIHSSKGDLRVIDRPDLPVEIVTGYDTSIEKALIVDGCNRSTSVTAFNLTQNKVSEVHLFEARGHSIHEVFPSDFGVIIRNISTRPL